MDTRNNNPFITERRSLEDVCGTMLLGRLGTEVAKIYGEVLTAPLPERLRRLIEQLDGVEDRRDRGL